jgi:hypothetical protein
MKDKRARTETGVAQWLLAAMCLLLPGGMAQAQGGQIPWAWGDNGNLPKQVSGITDVTAIAAGFGGGLALKSDGTV